MGLIELMDKRESGIGQNQLGSMILGHHKSTSRPLLATLGDYTPDKMAQTRTFNLRKPVSLAHPRNKSSLGGLQHKHSSVDNNTNHTFRSASEGSRHKISKIQSSVLPQKGMANVRGKSEAAPKNQNLLQIRAKIMKKGKVVSILKHKLLHEIEKVSYHFLKNCEDNNKDVVLQYLVTFLNYAVDLNLIGEVGVIVKYMAEFSLIFALEDKALFYFNQLRKFGLYLTKYQQVTDSLIGMAKCCSKIHRNEEAIVFLRKGLMYAWGIDSREKELKIYDEFGMKYFLLGNIEKAQYYHERFTGGIVEDNSSKLKTRIQGVIEKQQRENERFETTVINKGLMLHLNLPIKDLKELESIGTASIRAEVHDFRQLYYDEIDQCGVQLAKIFKERQFCENLPSPTYRDPNEIKKLFIQHSKSIQDTKLNLIIQRFQSRRMNREETGNSLGRQSLLERRTPGGRLDNNMRNMIKAPISRDWESSLMNKFKTNPRQNPESGRNLVVLKGSKPEVKVSFEVLHNIFKAFYEQILEC